jgi:hypothetical protein
MGETELQKAGAGEPLISRYLLTVKSLDEFGEVVPSVMRTRSSLRMVLNSAGRQVLVPDPFHGAIIEVTVCHFK